MTGIAAASEGKREEQDPVAESRVAHLGTSRQSGRLCARRPDHRRSRPARRLLVAGIGEFAAIMFMLSRSSVRHLGPA